MMNGYDPATYGSNDNPKTSNSVWSYSREITINPATPSNNYHIKIKLNSSIFNYGSVNLDGSDIRFFDISNNSLDYWVENWNTTGKSIIWVEVLYSGTSLIYMRYGNTEAISESNGDNTLKFYAKDKAGNVGVASVIVTKITTDIEPPPAIPGYDLYLLIGALGVISTILIRKRLKS